jgi:hypothetical protein
MGRLREVARQFRESVSKTAIDESAKWVVRGFYAGAGVIVAILVILVRPLLSRAWSDGLVFGALVGLGVFLLMILSIYAADGFLQWGRGAVARADSVESLRLLYFNQLSPAIDSAISYLKEICVMADRKSPLGPSLASLLRANIVGPCSNDNERIRHRVVEAKPGKLSSLEFATLNTSFTNLIYEYSSVVQWIRVAGGEILEAPRLPEYEILRGQHEAFFSELKKLELHSDLMNITTHLLRLEDQLPAQPPPSPPSPTASG